METTKSHLAKSNQLSVEMRINENNRKRTDQYKQAMSHEQKLPWKNAVIVKSSKLSLNFNCLVKISQMFAQLWVNDILTCLKIFIEVVWSVVLVDFSI